MCLFLRTQAGHAHSDLDSTAFLESPAALALNGSDADRGAYAELLSISPNLPLHSAQLGTVHRWTFGGVVSGYHEPGKYMVFRRSFQVALGSGRSELFSWILEDWSVVRWVLSLFRLSAVFTGWMGWKGRGLSGRTTCGGFTTRFKNKRRLAEDYEFSRCPFLDLKAFANMCPSVRRRNPDLPMAKDGAVIFSLFSCRPASRFLRTVIEPHIYNMPFLWLLPILPTGDVTFKHGDLASMRLRA